MPNQKQVFVDVDMVVADNRARLMANVDASGAIRYETYYAPDIVQQDIALPNAQVSLEIIRRDFSITFLTSRPTRVHSATREWLREHKLRTDTEEVLFVKTPLEKVPILQNSLDHLYLFIDDCKYDYQSGNPKVDERFVNALQESRIPFFLFDSNWPEVIQRHFVETH